jgi:hypothetical protein
MGGVEASTCPFAPSGPSVWMTKPAAFLEICLELFITADFEDEITLPTTKMSTNETFYLRY